MLYNYFFTKPDFIYFVIFIFIIIVLVLYSTAKEKTKNSNVKKNDTDSKKGETQEKEYANFKGKRIPIGVKPKTKEINFRGQKINLQYNEPNKRSKVQVEPQNNEKNSSQSLSVKERLYELEELNHENIITPNEYKKLRKKVLDDL